MVVPVDAGKSDIRVHFARTIDRVIGNFISAVAAFFALIMFWLDGKSSTNQREARSA
jgi:hypothetical protein